jgi:hypothetical protein
MQGLSIARGTPELRVPARRSLVRHLVGPSFLAAQNGFNLRQPGVRRPNSGQELIERDGRRVPERKRLSGKLSGNAAERGPLEGWSVGPGAGFFAEIEVQLMEDSLRMSGGCQHCSCQPLDCDAAWGTAKDASSIQAICREPRLSSRQFARTARGPFQVPSD